MLAAWRVNAFENYDNCDWGGDLGESDALAFIEEKLMAALVPENEYIEAPEAQTAVAAADVLARLKGGTGQLDAYTESVDQWVKDHPMTPPEILVRKGRSVLDRIQGKNSELRELWEQSPDYSKWVAFLDALKQRLK